MKLFKKKERKKEEEEEKRKEKGKHWKFEAWPGKEIKKNCVEVWCEDSRESQSNVVEFFVYFNFMDPLPCWMKSCALKVTLSLGALITVIPYMSNIDNKKETETEKYINTKLTKLKNILIQN